MRRLTVTLALLGALLSTQLGGCGGAPVDTRPLIYKDGERHLDQGIEAYYQGNLTAAAQLFQQALAEYSSTDAVDGIIKSHLNLCETALQSGFLDGAERHLKQVRYLTEREGIDSYRPQENYLQARLLTLRGEGVAAMAILDQALGENGSEDMRNHLPALLLRGRLALELEPEETERWITRLEKAMEKSKGELHARYVPYLLQLKGNTLAFRGESEQALQQLDMALTRLRARAERPGIAAVLEDMAAVEFKRGELASAEDRLQRALMIRIWMLDRPGTQKALRQLQQLYQDAGEVNAQLDNWISDTDRRDKADWLALKQLLSVPFYGERIQQQNP